MKQRKIESALFNEMCDIAPDMTEELLCACEESDTPTIITDISKARKPRNMKKILSLAACIAIVFTVAFSNLVLAEQKCTVTVDVNPSIELSVNGLRIVTDVRYNNSDAEKLFSHCELKGESLDDATALITEKLCENGYISQEHNGILLSVSSEKGKYADILCAKLIESVSSAAKENGSGYAVLYQKIGGDEVSAEASPDMSSAKALLISKIADMTDRISAEDMRNFSVQELIAISVSLDRLPDNTLFFGSLLGYCSASDAEAIAMEDAFSAAYGDSTVQLIRYGKELAYDVVINGENRSLEYIISATTGEILNSTGGAAQGGTQGAASAPVESSAVLSPAEAISKFIAAGGYLVSDVADILDDISISPVMINGTEVYKITFELNGEWQTVYISKKTAEAIG